jgi:hypothetical protein
MFYGRLLLLLAAFLVLFGSITGCGSQEEKFKARAASGAIRPIQPGSEAWNFLQKHPVYISMTTSPGRVSKIHHVLDTLDLRHVKNIFLNLPLRFSRDQSEYPLPMHLLQLYENKVKFLRPPKDLGPITKLLPAIQYAKDQGEENAIVIVVDDDTAYPRGMVSEIIHSLSQHQNTVVAASAQDLPFWGIDRGKMPPTPKNQGHACLESESSFCQVVEGFGSIGYPAGTVDVELMRRLADSRFSKECFVSDDLVISFSLALSGVDRFKIRNSFLGNHLIHQFAYGFEGDALHRGGGLGLEINGNMNTSKYQRCHQKLMEIAFDPVTGRFKSPAQVKMDWDQTYLGDHLGIDPIL